MTKRNRSLNASCLCKGINMTIKGQFRPVINCHCIQCAKTHGNYAAYTSVLEENITYKSKSTLKWFVSSAKAKRGFCKNVVLVFFLKDSAAKLFLYQLVFLKIQQNLKLHHIFISIIKEIIIKYQITYKNLKKTLN